MSEIQPFARLPRGLAPLGYRDFTLYWLGLTTTNTGRWIEQIGVVWLVYQITDAPLLVGLLGAGRAVPAIVLSPIAGVVSDRISPRLLLFTTQATSLLASLALGLLIFYDAVELWHIYAEVTIQAIVTTFDAAARQTLFPRLVPRQILSRAVTLGITATRFSKFIGPPLGGFLIANVGLASPFFGNAITYVGLMVAVAAMRPLRRVVEPGERSFVSEFLEGIRYIFATPVLSGLLKLELVFGFFEMNPTMIAIIGREILGAGPQALGFLLAAPAVGSFLGIAWMLSIDRQVRSARFSIVRAFVYGAVLTFLSMSHSYAVSFAALAMIGVLEVQMTVNRTSIMQLAAPHHLRGRVMSNMGFVTRGVGPFSETQSGALATLVGPSLGLLTAASTIALAAGLTAIFNRKLWEFTLPDGHST